MDSLHGLVESRNKTLIIGFLLLAPQRAFTVRELAKRLGWGEGVLSRELGQLARYGMVKVFTKRGRKYYLISSRHRLLADLKPSLTKNQRKYEDELFIEIRRLGNIRAAFLSGIFTGYPELPVDLLLVGKVNLNRLQSFLDATQKLMGNEINYSIMSEAEFKSRRDTFDRFIKDIFDYPHLVVVDHLAPKGKKSARVAQLARDRKFNVMHF